MSIPMQTNRTGTIMNPCLKQFIMLLFLFTVSFSAISAQSDILTMKLKPCPDSPNCVSSQSDSASHHITPLPYQSSATEAMVQIKKIILALPNSKLIQQNDHYLHVEFKTRVLKFIDDVEIVIDDSEKVIHLRSASRSGYWDLGVNRKRIINIQKKFLLLSHKQHQIKTEQDN